MHITVNGRALELPSPFTMTEFLAWRGLAGKRLATELNGEILPRSQYDQHALRDGDTLEIVGAVGGG
ncbi:MAG: sulfur carrier protein ThiS [Pseudomonadota bacterium]